MNGKILEKAKKSLANKKFQEEMLAKKNLEKAMQDPTFAQYYSEYMHAMIESAKNGKIFKDDKLKKSYLNRLKQLNIDNIEPVYECKTCEDTGSVDGKICDCLKKEITKLLAKESGFNELKNFSEANFSLFEKPEQMKILYDKMKEWCNQKVHSKNIIFISGDTGTGKTFLLQCMANELLNKCKFVYLVTAFNMGRNFVDAVYSFDNEKRDALLENYLGCDYLFIDDLGTEIMNNATLRMIFTILNERKIKGLPTIISSNLSLQDIEKQYDQRILSRLMDSSTIRIKISEKDLRLKI